MLARGVFDVHHQTLLCEVPLILSDVGGHERQVSLGLETGHERHGPGGRLLVRTRGS